MDPETTMDVWHTAEELYEIWEVNGGWEAVENIVENIEEALESVGDAIQSDPGSLQIPSNW